MFSGGKTTLDEARELVSDAELWPRVRDFLWDFAPQVHESWLEDVCGRETMDPGREVGSSLVSSLSSSPRVKRFVLDKLGVEPFFFDFPRGDWSRLALLDGAALLEIAGWLGALACADDLRRVTDGTTVRELKASLRGIYPDVFSFTAYFTGLDLAAKEIKDATVPEGVVAAGLDILFTLFDACPAPLVARLKLKFPKRFCDLCALCGGTERSAAGAAVKKLLKLKFPEAYSLCCL